MNRITDYKQLATDITTWIRDYAIQNNIKSLVVGVSGGVDSAVVSTLCAMTGLQTICVMLPIDTIADNSPAEKHILWLSGLHDQVHGSNRDLTLVDHMMYEVMMNAYLDDHARANTKARLRMTALYHIACATKSIVVGTGNKVEDFGIGFFTKYGDGGVDISPIADLYKTEVRELGRYLGIADEIINAAPTDGLWADGRTDEQQIGCTYEELEWCMEVEVGTVVNTDKVPNERQIEILRIYDTLYKKNQHKMQPIPIYKLNQ